MKIIIFDLDDVLLPCNPNLLSWHNEKFGTDYRFEDIKDFELSKLWGGTVDGAVQKILDFYESEQFKRIMPLPDAYSVIKRLREKGFTPIIITSRPDTIERQTRDFIKNHFPGLFNDEHIFFTNHIPGKGKKRSKGQVCVEEIANPADIVFAVEDSLLHAESFLEHKIPVYLFNAPWNEGVELEGMKRIISILEILKEFQ